MIYFALLLVGDQVGRGGAVAFTSVLLNNNEFKKQEVYAAVDNVFKKLSPNAASSSLYNIMITTQQQLW